MQNNFQYNVLYVSSCHLTATVDGIDLPVVSSAIMNDGSILGKFFENVVGHKLSDTYIHKPTTGYDLLPKNSGYRVIEAKARTKHGIKLGPSSFYGKGRRPNIDQFNQDTPTKDFAIGDAATWSQTGLLYFTFWRGIDIVKLGHSLTLKKSNILFEGNYEDAIPLGR